MAMLSATVIVNALLVQSIISGQVPSTPTAVETVKEQSYQAISINSEYTNVATRDSFGITSAPAAQKTVRISDVPLGSSNSALVMSAMKYIGAPWDCTMLVEQSLRDLGYQIGDVGPMGFGGVGQVFYDPSQVQPGDIMMRGGHVAIWAGDGMTIQGGFGFGGVVYNSWEGPHAYSQFVRVG